MASLKKLFSDSVVYGLSSIIGRFLNYLLVPLYTYKIAASSGGYGIVTNIYAYTALLLTILTFGMETTFFYFANKPEVQARKAFSTALCSVGIVDVLFLSAVFLFIGPIADSMGYATHPEFIKIMATVVAIDAFQAILFAMLRFQGRAWKFAFLKLLFIVCNIGLNLFIFLVAPSLSVSHPNLMSWYDPSYQVGYIFVINLICTASITLGFIPELHDIRFGIDKGLLKQMLKYTWPLLLMGIVGILNQVADKICFKFIVRGANGDIQLGIYGACAKIAMIMAMITQAFRYAYEPFVFGNGRDSKSKESQALVMKYFIIFTLLAFLAVVCYMDQLRHLINSDYWEGLRAVPIVMMAEIFMGIYFNLSFWYKLTEKTWWGAILSAIGCAALLFVNFMFVPKYGYMACAWGGFVGYGTCMVLSYFIGQRHFPVPYPIKSIAAYFAVAIVLFYAAGAFPNSPAGWRFAYHTLLMLAYIAFFAFNERKLVASFSKKIRQKIHR